MPSSSLAEQEDLRVASEKGRAHSDLEEHIWTKEAQTVAHNRTQKSKFGQKNLALV
jgi:hypothetical protein